MLLTFNKLYLYPRRKTTLPLSVPSFKISKVGYWPIQGQVPTPGSGGMVIEHMVNVGRELVEAVVIKKCGT